MTPNGITAALIAQLKSSTFLSFVDDSFIYEGVREGVVNFPCIVIESDGDSVVDYKYPYEVIKQRFKVAGFVSQYNKDHQLTDDGVKKGLLTLKNAIKAAITSKETLGLADVYETKIPSSQDDNTNYPIRGFTMIVEVMYRQNRETRV